MQAKLRRMREERADGDSGFTLIELLVVVVIIGVLVAIATPLYLNYRKGASNKSAASDVRGAISAMEQYYTDNGNLYPTPPGTVAASGTSIVVGSMTITVSSGDQLQWKLVGTTSYVMCGISNDGGAVYKYDSSTGGSVAKSAATTLVGCLT